MMLVAEFLLFVGLFLSSYLFMRWWNDLGKASRRYPPSMPSLPLVGSLPFIRGFNNFADFFMRKADQLGPIFTLRAGNKLVLILNSKAVIEDALVNHSSAFSGRAQFYSERIMNPNNKGLISMNTTQEWKKYHQLSLSILRQLGFGVKAIMETRILAEFEFFTDYVLKYKGKSFNPRELVYICTTNVIMSISFGCRHEYSLGISELGYQIKRAFDNLDVAVDFSPMLRFLPFRQNKLREVADSTEMILKIVRMKTVKCQEDDAEDCFARSYLKRVGPDYDEEQLSFTLRDLFTAGTDTTANTILWTLSALANNPDVQNRLRAEIDAVVPRDRLPSLDDQTRLPFVQATILEILRWKPLVPLAVPHMTLSDTNVGNYEVPAGTLVLVNLYAAHMDPKVWKDPEIFRPERFLDKEGQVIRRETVIPFSLGRRSCLGEVLAQAEVFLILTGLVQRFFIRPPEGQNTVDVNPIEPIEVVLTASEFNIRLIKRE